MEKTLPGLTTAEKPANTPAQQQQISAAEQKSRMDLQMSTALHGTAAFQHLPLKKHLTYCWCVTFFKKSCLAPLWRCRKDLTEFSQSVGCKAHD